MSGQLSHQLAGAAVGYALRAEATARGISIGDAIRERTLKNLEKHKPERESLPGKTWAAIDIRTRTVLMMLASEQAGDPRKLAQQPWASIPEADQCRIASTARHLHGELRNAASLF